MKIKSFLRALLIPGILLPGLLHSCKKTEDPSQCGDESTSSAMMQIGVECAPLSKAGSVQEDRINTLSLLVFRVEGETRENPLEIYHRVDGTTLSGGQNGELSFLLGCTTGKKHIYAVANIALDDEKGLAITNESDLEELLAPYTSNTTDNLVMVGSGSCNGNFEPVLKPGLDHDNLIRISLRRLCSKIIIGSIIPDFGTEAATFGKVSLKRIFLLNVPKRTRLLNGDHLDVLGRYAPTPDEVLLAPDAPHFYDFPAPSPDNGDDGLWNHVSAEDVQEGNISLSKEAEALGAWSPSSSKGTLCDNGRKFNLSGDKVLYGYPNSSTPSSSSSIRDETTKVVLEVEFKFASGNAARTLYYPISIPYMQPHYCYRISSVTLRKLGSEDPNVTLDESYCNFILTIAPWIQGEITGSYNGTSSEGRFTL